jgi:ankyrin repeat protein
MIDAADPAQATEGLVQLATNPPNAGVATLYRMAELLLQAGADPNHHEALYHACEHPNHAVLDAILAHPKLEPPWLSYCLLRKLDFDDLEGARKMLKRGADPNLRSRHGDREMSLHHAIRRGRNTATMELLQNHGARPDIINIHNHTARRQAIRFGRTDLGATAPDATSLDYWLFELWHRPAKAPPPETLGKQDIRLLPEAAWMQCHDAVINMLEAGFPIRSTTHDELQAIDFAAYHQDEKLAEILIRHGATRDRYEAAVQWLTPKPSAPLPPSPPSAAD